MAKTSDEGCKKKEEMIVECKQLFKPNSAVDENNENVPNFSSGHLKSKKCRKEDTFCRNQIIWVGGFDFNNTPLIHFPFYERQLTK